MDDRSNDDPAARAGGAAGAVRPGVTEGTTSHDDHLKRRLALLLAIRAFAEEAGMTDADSFARALTGYVDAASAGAPGAGPASELKRLAELAALTVERRAGLDSNELEALVVVGDLDWIDARLPDVAVRAGRGHADAWRIAQVAFTQDRLSTQSHDLREQQLAIWSLLDDPPASLQPPRNPMGHPVTHDRRRQ